MRSKTGLVPDAYFTGTKLWWLMQNINDIKSRILSDHLIFGTIDSWLIWNLTRGIRDSLTPDRRGAHVTDYSNASRTMLFDINRLQWDRNLLEIEGNIPTDVLPLPRPSSERQAYGFVGKEIAKLFNYADAPVTGDVGDQQAALFGQACYNEGSVKSTYGTGNFILMNTGNKIIRSGANLLARFFILQKREGQTTRLKAAYLLRGLPCSGLRTT
ncbi:MAG: FGGY family carbohydrate kinase [Nitrososphaeria archaeon]